MRGRLAGTAFVCIVISIPLVLCRRVLGNVIRWKNRERQLDVQALAGASKLQSLCYLTALVFELLDSLQAGSVPSDSEIDVLREIFHEVGRLGQSGLASQLEERLLEPGVEDLIKYTLGIVSPPAVDAYFKAGDDVPNEDNKGPDASPRDILVALVCKQSLSNSGPKPSRSLCFSFEDRPLSRRSLSAPRLSRSSSLSAQSLGLCMPSRALPSHKESDSSDSIIQADTCCSAPVQVPTPPTQAAHQRWSKLIASDCVNQAEGSRVSKEESNASDSAMESTSCIGKSDSFTGSLDLFGAHFLQKIRFSAPEKPPFQEKRESEDVPKPEPLIMDEVDRLLATAGSSFFFDTMALDVAANGHALSVLSFFILEQTGLAARFHMNLTQLARFLRKIEAGYNKAVPYHNEIHAADVLQTMHAMWCLGGLGVAMADPLLQLAAYLAAIIHDHEHEGRNNTFLIVTGSELALRYNDTSPLEQHHLASAFSVLKEHKIMPSLPKHEFLRLRKVIIDMVLATDMAKHCDIMVAIGALVTSVSVSSRLEQPAITTTAGGNQVPLALDGGTSKTLLLQAALKCADLGHMAAPLEVHLKWVSLLEKEFQLQGDVEAELSLPVSPLCDRNHANLWKSQVGFIDFVVAPLFQAFVMIIPDTYPLKQATEANRRFWAETNS